MDSFELQDELSALAEDPSRYEIPNEHDFSTEDPARFLEAAVEAVAESSDAIRDPEVFDVYRSVLKYSASVPISIMNKVLDSISSGLHGELESTIRDIESGDQNSIMLHKLPLELFAFLLQWFVNAAEKVKAPTDDNPAAPAVKGRRGRGGKAAGGKNNARAAAARFEEKWSWEEHIPATLQLISKILIKLQTLRIWTTSTEREAFVSCLVKPAYHVLENEHYMKIETIRLGAMKVICVSVKHHNQIVAAHTNIIQNLQFFEHLPETLATCLHVLATTYDHTQLGDEILREIASKTFNAQDNKGPRHFSRFLIEFARLSPRSVLKQLSLLLGQLDSEAYPMRIALVEVIGYLIHELATGTENEDDSKQTQKKINGLFDLLHERILDLSSYVRAKVFAVLSKVFDIKTPKFPKQRLASTRAAVAALEDKASTVRKSAVSLLIKLLITHPYGMMHGGMLTHDLWESEYDTVKKELEKVESKLGSAVLETQETKDDNDDEGGDTEEDESEDEEDGEEGDETPKNKNKKSKKRSSDDSMDVDEDDEADSGEDEDEDDSMSVDGEEPRTPRKKKPRPSKLKPRKSQIDMNAMTQEQAALAALEADELLRLKLKKKYYAEALSFIHLMEGAMEILSQLLGSTSKAEVLETMEFYRIAYEYELEGAQEGIRKMLHLIWVKDNSTATSEDGKELKGIRQRLLEVYKYLYFPDAGEDKEEISRVAKNMIERTYDATLAELTSLEEMMRIMMEENQVNDNVVSRLWTIYSTTKMIPNAQRRAAIIILGMLALANKDILVPHIETMMKVGFGRLGRLDLELARYTCVALQRLTGSAKKVKGSLKDDNIRYSMDHGLFEALNRAVERPCRQRDWFGLAEQAINAVYALGEHPDEWCACLIKNLTKLAFTPKEKNTNEGDQMETDEANVESGAEGKEKSSEVEGDEEDQGGDGDVTMSQADITLSQAPTQTQINGSGKKDIGDAFELSQLLFVVGHVAIKEIVFLELVEREWKRQKDEKTAADKQALVGKNKTAKDREGEELDQVAGNAEDEIGDHITAVRESELLYGDGSLLKLFGPMLVHICGSPHKFKNPLLRTTAIISLSKFLCVSSKFCDEHHHLLFRILDTSKDATIRSNVVIALGDVAVSFSSIFDENSHELYKGLSDGVVQVKKNTLMVLTHLILNGMVKVKGQLGEMAKCLEDQDKRISDLAKLFFKELSGKENAIYNNLPDVISHLSTGEFAVDEEVFQNILRFIFSFIDKEKQAENIVEKLCQRFRLSDEPRQWRDIAFCLSLLPFKSERSMKKLIEGLQFYRDKLHEEEVYKRFADILNKARSNKSKDKPDTELDEFEKILEEHKIQGEEDEAMQKKVEKEKRKARKRAAVRKPSARRKAPAKQATIEEDDDE